MKSQKELIDEALREKKPQVSIGNRITEWEYGSGTPEGLHSAVVGDIRFYFNLSKSAVESNLVLVTLTAGGGNSWKRESPKFHRWKYKAWTDAHVLSIDDPMAWELKYMPGWFYGTADTPFYSLAAELVRRIIDSLSIDDPKIMIIGSSSGGTAAVYISSVIGMPSTVISINGQVAPSEHRSYARLLNAIGKKRGYDDPFNRGDLSHIIIEHPENRYILLENIAGGEDYNGLNSLSSKLGIEPEYGIGRNGNLVTWLYYSPALRPHKAQDWAQLFPFIQMLADNFDDIGAGFSPYVLRSLNHMIESHHSTAIEVDLAKFDSIWEPLEFSDMNDMVMMYANNGNIEFQKRLARQYRYGRGREKDLSLAKKWMAKAFSVDLSLKDEYMEILKEEGSTESLEELDEMSSTGRTGTIT